MNRLCILATILCVASSVAPGEDETASESSQASAIASDTARTRLDVRRQSFTAIDDGGADEELSRAVKRLASARLESQQPEKAPQATSQPAKASSATSQPAKVAPQTTIAAVVTAELARNAAAKAAQAKKASALDRIKSLPPGSIVDPVALADALYLAGHKKVAAVFYEKALETRELAPARSWLMFQLGNCHKSTDPQVARGYYKRLLSEHPESIWRTAAEVADHLLAWKTANAPEKLLKDITAMIGQQ